MQTQPFRVVRADALKLTDRVIGADAGCAPRGTVEWVEWNPDVPGNVIVHFSGHDYECAGGTLLRVEVP